MTPPTTTDEASSGIYIDFEGRTDQAPILLGVFIPDASGSASFEQIVLDPRYAPAARAASLRVLGIEAAIEEVVTRSETEGRQLIGWSLHEVEVVQRHCSDALTRRFVERYVDAKVVAKAARSRSGMVLPPARRYQPRHTLARYMKLIGHHVPPAFGPGWTGTTIRRLDQTLARQHDWTRVTRRLKSRWTVLLRHNREDCKGTYAVAQWATHEIGEVALSTLER